MPHTLSIFRFQFSPPSERHYNSDLSIWLSVDPMSDKYPGVSPYAYCANNPVRLVDPNGRTWETPDDAAKADEMREHARIEIAKNSANIIRFNHILPIWSTVRKELVREYESRNNLLNEGLDGIDMMEQSETIFHFYTVNNGEICYSTNCVDENGQMHVYTYSDHFIETRWHETVHVSDWLCGKFDGMTNDGEKILHCFAKDEDHPNERVLGHFNDGGLVEKHAYQSEFAFSRKRFDGKSLKPAFFLKHITGEHRTDENR